MARSLVAAIAASVALAAVPGDKVVSLPGWNGPLLSNMYSGYLSAGGGKHLHYVFIENIAGNAAGSNVQLWLNGGPGCSSLEGMFAENGPYWITPGTTSLFPNPYTWANATNMLFLESPAGVGFSYSDTPNGLVHNDSSTAADALAALTDFFAKYPEYNKNNFYISGESYAGIYVPTLAYAVVQYNNGKPSTPINLKGIMVGNGCLGTEVGVCGDDYFANSFSLAEWAGHGLVSPDTNAAALQACGNFQNENPACDAALAAAADEVGHINIYDVYSECKTNFTTALRRPLNVHEKRIRALGLGGPDACIDAGDLTAYLNQQSVITAMHAVQGLPWEVCTGNITYTPTEPDERRVVYPTLLAAGVRVLIFNGEADACVPYTDNYWWTRSMNLTVQQDWHAWMVDSYWVGGYAVNYAQDFTFATVRGAGHMVPEFQPRAAWTLFNTFITGGVF